MAYLYGVFVGTKWGMTKNKRKAIAAARKENGSVYAMPLPPISERSWDAPTFRAVADLVWSMPMAEKRSSITLLSGRTISRTRMDNGAWMATPTTGSEEMTPQEWEEYVLAIRAR